MQLLQGKQDDALEWIMCAHKVMMTFQTIRSLAIALTHLDYGGSLVIVIFMGLTTWIFLHFEFKLLGRVYEESTDCLKKWQGARQAPRWFRRTFMRSCWRLKISVGGMYYADRSMGLTLNGEIFKAVVEATLASL